MDQIAALYDRAYAAPEEKPIRDTEPEVTARLVTLLERVRAGTLGPEEFAYVYAGYFPGTMARYTALLQDRAAPEKVELYKREQLGDDRIYTYVVTYPGASYDVELSLAPDDRLSGLSISER